MAPQRAAVVVHRCSLTLGITTPASIQTLPVVVWPRAPLAARPCVSLVCARECVRPKIRHDARHTRGKAEALGTRKSAVGRVGAVGSENTFSCASLRAVSASTTALLYAHPDPDYAPLFPARHSRRSHAVCRRPPPRGGGRGSHATSFIKTTKRRSMWTI